MRYVTNEERRRRTLFKPTLWAVAVCPLLMTRCTVILELLRFGFSERYNDLVAENKDICYYQRSIILDSPHAASSFSLVFFWVACIQYVHDGCNCIEGGLGSLRLQS